MGKISCKGRLDPQMAAALQKQVELVPPSADLAQLPLADIRQMYNHERRFWNADAPPMETIENHTVDGPCGAVSVRLYFPSPQRPLPGLIYLHGGGWVVGNLDTHDKIMRLLALRSGAAVVGVDYHLAPEHRFPTQLDEVLAVLAHIRRRGNAWGLVPSRLALGGDSAGANMSLSIAVSLRDQTPDPLKALLLFYGAFGLRDSGSRRLYGSLEDGMRKEDLDFYIKCYLNDSADEDSLRFDVFRADLSRLPFTYIGAAEYDPLVDDSVTLQRCLAEVGVPHTLHLYQGVLHGFLHLSRMVDKASQAIDDAAGVLREQLLVR